MCRHLLLVVSIMCAAGCERFAHRYDYQGTLLQADGSPAAGRRVAVLPWERFFAFEKDVGPVDVLDHFATVTNRDGRFSGSVNGETTYLRWLCLPTAPAPPLNKVDLWAHDGGAWSKIPVPLDAASQERVFSGGRSIALPTVTLPAPATSRVSSGAAELPAPSRAPASTAPALAGPSTRKSFREQHDEAVAREIAQFLARHERETQRRNLDFGMTQPWLIDALAKGYDEAGDIAHFRRFLMNGHPQLERVEWIGDDDFLAPRTATRPARAAAGYLIINLMQGGHRVWVTYDLTTGKLKGFEVKSPAPVRLSPLERARP